MARKVLVQLIDDLSGEDAKETVRFALDGAEYEIDLSAGNAAELRGALERFISGGRRIRGASGGSAAGAGRSAGSSLSGSVSGPGPTGTTQAPAAVSARTSGGPTTPPAPKNQASPCGGTPGKMLRGSGNVPVRGVVLRERYFGADLGGVRPIIHMTTKKT
ncbi:hypothetical protein GCM10009825_01180 [Arthrobacter humicola]|uniref:Lsr2 dimerization domain-containing protein n=1 Tax=Arthrobacter humicola TaxID=409291 RepID=A0ABP5K0H0_9MICC